MKSSKSNNPAAGILIKSSLACLFSAGAWALQAKLLKAVENAVKLHLIEAIVLLNICAIILLLSININENDDDGFRTLKKAVGFLPATFKYITLTFNVFMSSYSVVLVLNAFIDNLTIPSFDVFSKFADHILPLIIGFYVLNLVMPLSMYLLSSPPHTSRNRQNCGGGNKRPAQGDGNQPAQGGTRT